MRMWCLNPQILCRKHLLGEHNELHKFCGAINHKKNVTGYFTKKLIQLEDVVVRHAQLVDEMISRGYNHKSNIQLGFDLTYMNEEDQEIAMNSEVDVNKNLSDLLERCPKCRERYERYKNGNDMS